MLALALLLGGCAQLDTGHVATQRVLAELDCPEEDTEIEQIGAYRYRGDGCGETVTVACTASSFQPRCMPEHTAGGEWSTSNHDLDDPPEDDSPIEEPALAETPNEDVEQAIRAGLDARREDILACVGVDRVAIRAGYAPDGSVALSLRGELEGTAEEGCVQDALDGVRVPSDGEAGVVIHLVR